MGGPVPRRTLCRGKDPRHRAHAFLLPAGQGPPPKAKAIIIGALGYFILPTDLIPDFLPGVGYGDDMSALAIALGTVTAYIKDEHKAKARERFDKLLRKGNTPPPAEFS